MSLRKAYYYLYYKIHKAWSKSDNPLLSTDFRADISMIAIKIWFVGIVGVYLSIILKIKLPKLSISNPIVFVPLILSVGSTLCFLTFSNKWKLYFEEFDKWPKSKNMIGGIIVWSIVIAIFINVFISVELMRKLNG